MLNKNKKSYCMMARQRCGPVYILCFLYIKTLKKNLITIINKKIKQIVGFVERGYGSGVWRNST